MITNERTWPSQRKMYRPLGYAPNMRAQERPYSQDETLKSVELQIERKTFFLTLKENARGRFLRISEEATNRRNSIIVPTTGLRDFQKLLEEMVAVADAVKAPALAAEI